MKGYVFILLLILSFTSYSKEAKDAYSATIERYKSLSAEKLLDVADNFSNSAKDSALICYSLIYNSKYNKNSVATQQIVVQALNKASRIYFYYCDYKLALELLLKALAISETIGYEEYIGRIYNNIGNIHSSFNEYKKAETYYRLASTKNYEQSFLAAIYNNLGLIYLYKKDCDTAMYFFRKSYTERKKSNDSVLYEIYNNFAYTYKELGNNDSVIYYCRIAIENARAFNLREQEALTLSNIGRFYYDLKSYDSAIYYIEQSNCIAQNDNLLNILVDNYLYYSKINEQTGNKSLALQYFQIYSEIKDSIFNASKYSDINQLQFLYDMAKVDKQIQELNAEQELKAKTISFQRTIQWILISAFLIVIAVLLYIYSQKKRLNMSYKILVNKNIEIVNQEQRNEELQKQYVSRISELEEELSTYMASTKKEENRKPKCIQISDDKQNELKNQILTIMNDKSIVCSSGFSLSKLAEIAGSNYTYTSQVVNNVFGKNFNAFVNEYRIKEAMKMLQEPKYRNYTIEAISKEVGYESRNSFCNIFKEIVGVTPTFYIRSLNSPK